MKEQTGKTILNRHIIDTANYANYALAKAAAEKAGLEIRSDYRANCFKCYHLEVTAHTVNQVYIMDLIGLATFAAPGQDQHKQKLSDYTYGDYDTIQAFIDHIREAV